MSLFTIIPNSRSQVLGSMNSDGTTATGISTNYILSKYDMAEADRVQVRSSAGVTHRFIYPSARASLTILATGSSESNVEVNCRTLRLALSDPKGGYIAIRPLGLSTSIHATYYRYKPTWDVEQGIIQANTAGGGKFGRVVKVSVEINGLADNGSLFEFESGTTDTRAKIESTAFKGDAIIPSITVNPATMTTDPDKILLWINRKDEAYSTIWDPVAEDPEEVGWTEVTGATGVGAYNNSYITTSSTNPTATLGHLPMSVGPPYLPEPGMYNFIPIVQAPADTYTCRVGVIVGDLSPIYTRWQDVPVGYTNFTALKGFESLPIPPASYWSNNNEAYMIQNTKLIVEFQLYGSSTTGVRLSGVVMCRSDIWIGEIEWDKSIFTANPAALIYIQPDENSAAIQDGLTFLTNCNVTSTPKSMVMSNTNSDYWIHALMMDKAEDSFIWGETYTIAVYGYHGTIFPFGEAI